MSTKIPADYLCHFGYEMQGVNLQKNTRLTLALHAVVIILLYALAGWLCRQVPMISGHTNPPVLWLPAGIAVAGILLSSYLNAIVVFIGAFLFAMIDGLGPNATLSGRVLGIAAGDTFGALACAFVLRRFLKFDNRLEREWDTLSFLIIGCVLAAGIDAVCMVAGSMYHLPANWVAEWLNIERLWIANALGILVVTPVIITCAARSSIWMSAFRVLEVIVCMAGVVATTVLSLGIWTLPELEIYRPTLLPAPFLIWAAMRFGSRGAAVSTLLLTVLAIYSVMLKRGPLCADTEATTLRMLGCFIGILGISNLLLGTASSQRSRWKIELVESERRLRAVVADQMDLICRFEPSGRLTFVNEAFCRFHDKTEKELLGTDFFLTLEDIESGPLRKSLLELTGENAGLNFDHKAVAAAGHAEWHQCNFRRLRRSGVKSFEFQAVMQDITLRKRAELAAEEAKVSLEKANQQLQMAVAESRAAEQQANRANSAKSEFLANMSHELRTPLSGILGMIELLGQTRLDKRQREFATAATESADALLHIINDVLDFSKIEAGKMSIAHEEFPPRAVVESVLENAATRVVGSKKLAIAAIVRRDVPFRLMGDPIRLRQILLNLVGNAIKFTEKGEVVVRVTEQSRARGKSSLRFEVTDTGIGLTGDQIKQLFQPFVQADASSSRRFGGTGLGLAISRKVVELMGGKIGVNSAPGAGSTFWFELPLDLPPQPTLERSFPGLVFIQAVVAVPNANLRESLIEQMHGMGVVSRAAATPAELCQILQRDMTAAVIPVLICDEEMFEVGGEPLRRQLGENRERLQSILLADTASQLGAGEYGFAFFSSVLLKPVREQPLFDALVGIVAAKKPELTRPVTMAGDTEFVRRENAAGKQTAISNLRILAAEDHPFNRKLCQLMLDNFGAKAEWVFNGKEAVEKFQSGTYDVILMDCNMPVMDGLQATTAIRKIEEGKKISSPVRIIAITANALAGERERCLAAGMNEYISKPFTAQQLFNALLGALPTGNTAPQPDFNPGRIEQLCRELEAGAVADLVRDFLAEFPGRVSEIHRLSSAGEWTDLERAAHSLKGLTALFGFQKLADNFLAIEDAAEAQNGEAVRLALAELDGHAAQASKHLQSWLDANRQPAAG